MIGKPRWRTVARSGTGFSTRSRLLLLALVTDSTPVAAADIAITDARTYDPSSMTGLGLIIDGAAAQLAIGADDTGTTQVDLRNGDTVDNAGLITRTGTGNRGVVGGIGTVINRDGGQITAADATGVLLFGGGSVDNSGEGSLIRGGFRGVSIQGGSVFADAPPDRFLYRASDAAIASGPAGRTAGQSGSVADRKIASATSDALVTCSGGCPCSFASIACAKSA